MQLLKTESVSHKPERPASVPGPPDAPPAPSLVPTTASTKKGNLPPSASKPTQAAPAQAGQEELPLVTSTGGKEEYGYIVTNQRLELDYIQFSDLLVCVRHVSSHQLHLGINLL